MGGGVGVASIRSKNLIKARMQHEKTKIDVLCAKLVVGSDHLCDQAINLFGKAMVPLSSLESPEKGKIKNVCIWRLSRLG
jgi:hypothetical protein